MLLAGFVYEVRIDGYVHTYYKMFHVKMASSRENDLS